MKVIELRKGYLCLLAVFLSLGLHQTVCAKSDAAAKETIGIVLAGEKNARIDFGVSRLKQALTAAGYEVSSGKSVKKATGKQLFIGLLDQPDIQKILAKPGASRPGKEGYILNTNGNQTVIAGADASGALYGCLDLAERIKQTGKLPGQLAVKDQPEMVMRGACIGIQKPVYLPGRTVYEYPYTPENFPWLYDKALWIKYLDMLVDNRMNSLYLWNGHPFASLVKLKDYPYALEVDEETFRKNEEIFSFLTKEADKRGIWVIQMFYNIIVSKPFAEKHNIKTQDRKRPITPLISDYTRKSIAAFVEKYPNVGLLITLGEAMEGDDTDVEWFTKTIIPGVKDGLAALKTDIQPPIVLRGHDTNPQMVMKASLPIYKSLYTMNKYNGEALTTYQPRGPWAKMHREMSELGSIHIENVHILANLEPFRYGSADFIQKSVQAMHDIHGANGLHIYPEASYWDWPYTADNITPRQLQIDRDWVWYKAWARYAWNCRRDRSEEVKYWSDELDKTFGTQNQGGDILEAYEQAGEITPKLLRRFGITNGNRQTLTLGMTMSQLVNPKKYRVWPELYNSDGPEGETLTEYVEKNVKGEKHIGETPEQIIREVVQHGKLSVEAIDRAQPFVKKEKEEFRRIRNDMYCHRALADFFSEKVQAAELVLKYNHSKNITDLKNAVPHLEKSVAHFKELAALTKDTYLYANSMQTAQRRVPVGGNDGKNKTWVELLPFYEEELKQFKKNLALLESGKSADELVAKLTPVDVTLNDKNAEMFTLAKGEQLFSDRESKITAVAEELSALRAVRLNAGELAEKQAAISFSTKTPVKVLVGYFQSKEKPYLAVPNLETDASGNDFGQAEAKITAALTAQGLPNMNVHAYTFPAGNHTLVPGKGIFTVLGFIDGNTEIKPHAAAMGNDGGARNIDWLFE
ncbi:alpha-d-galacturonidase [Dyadobacter aurulentus]|uniref:alpha-d-galacturonidase n=1 Tax=Dyadobacter sp. UC 10 TaxID=2605428 RepID=UPI0011F1EB6C|nr:hypothetical protein [Dyadobacter sp. UC 10]KAA0989139.1 hypothetical protein FXO21_02645 [Dyadobacter sp. UC 10]